MERTKKWPWNWEMLSPLLHLTRITPSHPAAAQAHSNVLTVTLCHSSSVVAHADESHTLLTALICIDTHILNVTVCQVWLPMQVR